MEKISKIIDIFKSKWLKNTGKTIIFILIIIAIFLAINLIVSKIDPKDIDLTSEKLYSLSEESKEKIALIPDEDKIQIYMFDFSEQDSIVELAKQYTKANPNITLDVVEKATDRPDLVSKYNIESGYYTVLIVSGEKYKMFTSYDFYSYDYNTGKQEDITEQRLTNGIIGLSSIGKSTLLYMLTGHGEMNISSQMLYFNTYLELENYEIKELDLLSAQTVPEDCTSLIIASPEKDFNELEMTAIKEYIEKGGNILWFNDPYSATVETPNVNSILDMYGVKLRQDGFMVEQDTSNMAMGSPDFIIPSIEYSTITEKISKVLLIGSGKLEFAENLDELGVRKTNLLTTSEKSFFRTNIEIQSLTPVERRNRRN